jgi:N-acetylglucosamine-6-phosphate deacetylase
MLFRNARLILPDRIQRGALRVREGRIAEIGSLAAAPGEEIFNCKGCYLSPGFIDLHIHGAQRRDTMEATPEAFDAITRHHAKGGTTALCLTTVVATAEQIQRVLDAVDEYQKLPPKGARVLGVHVEGPYFSTGRPGAHWPQLIRNPDPKEYFPWLESGIVRQMTVAPELPGALELIEELSKRGIIASGGHSDAWDEEAAAACARGMWQVTHTYNCMSSQRRRGPYRVAGLLEFALSKPGLMCELIADGHHVSPTLMSALYYAKGQAGIILVTDAAGGAGLSEGESYTLGTLPAVVKNGVGVTADGSALASSTCAMIDCVKNMVREVKVPLERAVQMATMNPAAALRVENSRGFLRTGCEADLVVFDDSFEVWATFVHGQAVFDARS